MKRAEIFITTAAIVASLINGILLLVANRIYYAQVIYFKFGLFLPLIVGLLFVLLLTKSFFRPPERLACLTLVLVLAAVIGSVATILPQMLFDFEHLDSIEVDNRVYHVGLRLVIDGDNYAYLYECDSSGIFCERQEAEGCFFPFYTRNTEKTFELRKSQNALLLWVDNQAECVFEK